MMVKMVPRGILEAIKASTKHALLLGPRQTGKSTLLHSLRPDLVLDLSDEALFFELSSNPARFKEIVSSQKYKTVLLDEVQRLPGLLQSVQFLADAAKRRSDPLRFLISGSSARKLKRGGANLLPGRILEYRLLPLAARELDYDISTKKALSLGTLPEPYLGSSPEESALLLKTYSATYLKEEIQAESLTRNISGFARFLTTITEQAGKFLDLSKAATKAKIPRQAAGRFLEILEDTLIAHRVEAYTGLESWDLVKHPRLFFFDVGVLNGMFGNFLPSNDRAGILFEHLFFNQLLNSAASKNGEIRIWNLRTRGGLEVDFIVEWQGNTFAIELKLSSTVHAQDLRGLSTFQKAFPKSKKPICFVALAADSNTQPARAIEGIAILPWQMVLKEMGL